jgi:hypothetical protein
MEGHGASAPPSTAARRRRLALAARPQGAARAQLVARDGMQVLTTAPSSPPFPHVRRALNSWLEMACSRKASKRAVAGALFGMRHHRVLRAFNSWIETSAHRRTACKCSPRRHPPPFPTGAFNSWIETSAHRRTAQRRMRSAINELRGSCLRAGWYRWSLRIHSSRRHRGLFARLRHRGPIASDCV